MRITTSHLVSAGVGALAPFLLVGGAQASADTCATFTTSPRCFFVKTDLVESNRVTQVLVESNVTFYSTVRWVGVQPGGPTIYSPIFRVAPMATGTICSPTVRRLPCTTYKDKTILKMQSATQNAHGGWTYADISRQNVQILK